MSRIRTIIHGFALSTLACSISSISQAAQPVADVIYVGGKVVTVNDLQPEAEAVAIKTGKIIAVGYRDEVMKLKGGQTKLIDLAGKAMLPGFIDPHGHVFNTGIQAISANLLPAPDGAVNDIPALQATLKDWAARNDKLTGKYGWIVGFGYDDAQLKEQRHPTREDLDQVSTELPVVIVHQSGHLGVMNSKALQMLGLTAASKNPPGGNIRRREGGQEPNGVLEENAFFGPFFGLMSKLGPDANKALFAAGVNLYKSFGYTTAQEGKASLGSATTMEAVAKSGKLDIDVVAYPDITVGAQAMKAPWLSRSYTQHFRIGGIKLTLDGSPQGKTAWLSKPYYKAPSGQKADYHGYSAFTDEQVNGFVEQAFQKNWQVLAHVNGDAAIDQFIAAVRAAEARHGMADRRPVAIHAQTAREDQVQAFHDLGIMPSFFPMHTYYWGDWHRDSVLGPERAVNISPLGWAMQRNMIFTSHHDAPVAMPDPMRVMHATVNRVTRSGQVLGPQHRVSPLVALKAHTLWSAYQHFEDKSKGSIEVGKLADFVIVDRSPLDGDPMTIDTIKVMETIKQGKSVFKREATQKTADNQRSCAESEPCIRVATLALNMAGVIDIHRHDD
ncbi:amidohydrolase [Uliginosibacterium aquaticum]|uniref:Amidohydrolase n=1 Tax=Uliginosibacterium aquaticum TaxID=2731212 RepID=A0ABX2IJV0_9RHOO|nr:amidohydrolase [Uliginosibacterium aquaticum]NSL54924.1 amidohydrolase [Uliginosibacterium aquaticum]